MMILTRLGVTAAGMIVGGIVAGLLGLLVVGGDTGLHGGGGLFGLLVIAGASIGLIVGFLLSFLVVRRMRLEVISLRDFMSTGEFGGLREDTHPEEVIGILGDPTHRHEMDSGCTIFQYGWYAVSFYEETPMYVRNDSLAGHQKDRLFSNNKFRIDAWIFNRPRPLTMKEVVDALSELSITYRHGIYNDRAVLQTESGVILDFMPDFEEPGITVCHAISFSFPEFPAEVKPMPEGVSHESI